MKKIKNNKGITLIALVITIVILLILAGITINSLMGSDGIIARAKWSAYVTEYEAVNEAKEMYATNKLIDKYGKNTYKVASLEGTGIISGDGEIIYPVGNQIEIYNLKILSTLRSTIMELENLTEEDLSNQEKVNLYEIDFNKIDVDAKKHYVVNVVSGMLYSIESEAYQKKAYHTPRMGFEVDENGRIIEEVEQELNIKEPGNYEIIINANEIVKWQSIEVVYNKFVEGTTTTVSKTSNDLYNWTEVSMQDAVVTEGVEKFVINKAENTQYIKISINLQENASGKNSEIYYIKVKYYKFQKTDIKPEIKNSGADVIGGIYTVPTSPSGNGQTEAKGTATVTQTVTLPTGDESYMLDLKEYGNPSTTVTITKPDGKVQTITGDELKTTEILGGSTITITTQLNAGDGVEEVQVLKKDNKLSSTTAGAMLSTIPEEWNTVEQKQYMYSNGGRGFWEKCLINNVAVGSTGILEKDNNRRIQVQYQTSIDGTEWSEPFTDLNEAENKRYLKILVNYQTKNNAAYGDTTKDKVTVMINDGYWTATFKDTDGTVLASQKAYYINSSKQAKITTISTAPSKTGKKFLDWLVGSTPIATNTEYTMTGNTTFVAEYMPIDIYTVADLVEFRDLVNRGVTYEGLTINLMNNLDLSSVCSSTLGSSWVPIGNYGDNESLYFWGNFKGNGYTISNIYINNNKLYQGLFGCVKNGSIDSLNVQGNITASDAVGGIVGAIIDSNSYNISNCRANVICYGNSNVGGIVGGIGGSLTVNINHVCNLKNITANSNAGGIAGGIWGISTVNVDKVLNLGNVTSNSYSAGGIVGLFTGESLECSLTINSACNSGNIYAKNWNTGGILGSLSSSCETTINNSYNIGTLMTDDSGIGGIVGNLDNNGNSAKCTVQYCHNVGTIISTTNNKNYMGAITGGNFNNTVYNGIANYWLSTCGANYGIGTVNTNTNATPYTAEQMIVQSNFAGWDFVNVWKMDTAKGYPVLRNMP